jgi:hypothetical protein
VRRSANALAALAVATLALATASVAVVGSAFADSATELDAFVESSVKPTTLDKREYRPVTLFSGVRTSAPGGVSGFQANPRREVVDYGKNIKFDLSATPVCSSLPPNGATAGQARAACPKSYLGSGHGQLTGPDQVTGPGVVIDDMTVSVFHGGPFGKNGIVLYTSSPTLSAAAPPIYAKIEKSKAGKRYGLALVIPHVPESAVYLVTEFAFTIERASKSVLGRCKVKTFPFQRTVTYADGSSEVATLSQPCKRR